MLGLFSRSSVSAKGTIRKATFKPRLEALEDRLVMDVSLGTAIVPQPINQQSPVAYVQPAVFVVDYGTLPGMVSLDGATLLLSSTTSMEPAATPINIP